MQKQENTKELFCGKENDRRYPGGRTVIKTLQIAPDTCL